MCLCLYILNEWNQEKEERTHFAVINIVYTSTANYCYRCRFRTVPMRVETWERWHSDMTKWERLPLLLLLNGREGWTDSTHSVKHGANLRSRRACVGRVLYLSHSLLIHLCFLSPAPSTTDTSIAPPWHMGRVKFNHPRARSDRIHNSHNCSHTLTHTQHAAYMFELERFGRSKL